MFHFQSYIGITAKTAFCIALLAGCFGCSADADDEAKPSIPEAQPDWTVLRDEVKSMRAELARQGAYAFVTNTATTPRTAPHIHSQCWVDWLPKEEVERRAYEQEKRDFGLDFVCELEKIALESYPLDDIDGWKSRTERAIALSDWIKTSKGYGNYLVKIWCDAIAATGVGMMAVDPRCDIAYAERLIARIDDTPANLVYRLAVLDEEAPHKYKMPGKKDSDSAQDNLERQWIPHRRDASDYFEREKGKFVGLGFRNAQSCPHEFAFYVRDPPPSEQTVKGLWNIKDHYGVCICGYESRRRRFASDLVLFRKLAGDIPRPPKNMTSPAGDGYVGMDYLDLFHDKWKPYKAKYGKNYAGTAASLVFFGQFDDHFTLGLRLAIPRREKLKNQNH